MDKIDNTGGYESDEKERLAKAIEAILEEEFYLPGSDGVAALRFQISDISARIVSHIYARGDFAG